MVLWCELGDVCCWIIASGRCFRSAALHSADGTCLDHNNVALAADLAKMPWRSGQSCKVSGSHEQCMIAVATITNFPWSKAYCCSMHLRKTVYMHSLRSKHIVKLTNGVLQAVFQEILRQVCHGGLNASLPYSRSCQA